MSGLDERMKAIEGLLAAFKLERLIYVILSGISVLVLLFVAIFYIIRSPEDKAWIISLFVPTGVITFSIGQILKMFNKAFEFVKEGNLKTK